VEQHRERAVPQPLANERRRDGAAAERHDHSGLMQQAQAHSLLERPERRLPVGGEDLLDRLARLALDLGVCVDRPPVELLGDGARRGALARAHEADQGQVAVRPGDHAREMRSRYAACAATKSPTASPPNFSTAARASSQATAASATTAAAGRTVTSLRSTCAWRGSWEPSSTL